MVFDSVGEFYMVSYDVESLFTNIPLKETINICTSQLFENVNIFAGLTKDNFKRLLELSVTNSFFIFDNKFYVQNEGLGMGLPLGPTFANIFMCFHEKNWLLECPSDFKSLFYRRYVDDCFALFKNKDQADKFLNYLNRKHNNIKFTIEYETNKQLSFLDILINRSNNKFVTSVYRKPTFTGLGLSFFSFMPRTFKISAIKTLIYRAYNISSSFYNFHNELEFLKNFFKDNGYPCYLFYNCVNRFLSGVYEVNQAKEITVPKLELYIKFPFFGIEGDKLKTDLKKLLEKYFPYIRPNFIFTNSLKIGSFFKFKDPLPKECVSSVIYKFSCPLCGGSYIGSTIKSLKCRASQHNNISSRTGLPVKAGNSSIMEHVNRSCNTNIDLSHFSIIDKVEGEFNLRLLESVYINKVKPNLNNHNSAVKLHILG